MLNLLYLYLINSTKKPIFLNYKLAGLNVLNFRAQLQTVHLILLNTSGTSNSRQNLQKHNGHTIYYSTHSCPLKVSHTVAYNPLFCTWYITFPALLLHFFIITSFLYHPRVSVIFIPSSRWEMTITLTRSRRQRTYSDKQRTWNWVTDY
jgi:hypothetical protein